MIKKRFLSMLVLLAAVATGAVAQNYKVSVKEGTEDANKWEIAPAEATTTGVAAGTTVTATYGGTKKVKSVKAKKKAAASLIVNPAVGQVIGDDGKNYADAAAATSAGATAVAKIVYVGSDNGEAAPYNHGLALALSDASTSCQWSTETGSTVHTYNPSSDSFTSESGLQYIAQNSDTYPAFKAAIANNGTAAPTGCSSWFLASGYQWQKMADAVGGYDKLGLSDAVYWSSTEQSAGYAWWLYSKDGSWSPFYKDAGKEDPYKDYHVRACLAF